jgi:hypothetical protein
LQTHEFQDARTGAGTDAGGIPMQESGYVITHVVVKPGNRWLLTITKRGAAVTANGITSGAGATNPAGEITDTEAVSPAPTATSLISSATLGRTLLGQQVTFTAKVSFPESDGEDNPSGTVRFLDLSTGAVLGVVPLIDGTASLPISTLGVGHHLIEADFLPADTSKAKPSQSSPLGHWVSDPAHVNAIQHLNVQQFGSLQAADVVWLTPDQVAGILNSVWFAALSAELQAALRARGL